ncbi:hypothetical protein PC110_g14031 [Phytophthora cactorum]|uniref:Uncharacterized protein n=1 Tax=Phytophthora cactorum TaxID=29920 RepID=A0A329S159_9STRA|nr:hypothetical protein PC110_g14031 [Phytophthora cactorum]
MAWLERHGPWIDWRSKTLGAKHLTPSGALRGSQNVRGAARYPQSGAGLVGDPLLCPDEDERGVARNPLSGVSQVNDSPLRGPRGTIDRRSRHHERSSGDAGGVARIPLSEGHGPHGFELRVSRDTDSLLRTAGAVVPGHGDGDVTTPTSSGRSRSQRERRMGSL